MADDSKDQLTDGELRKTRALLQLAREFGALKLRCGDVELELGPEPVPTEEAEEAKLVAGQCIVPRCDSKSGHLGTPYCSEHFRSHGMRGI